MADRLTRRIIGDVTPNIVNAIKEILRDYGPYQLQRARTIEVVPEDIALHSDAVGMFSPSQKKIFLTDMDIGGTKRALWHEIGHERSAVHPRTVETIKKALSYAPTEKTDVYPLWQAQKMKLINEGLLSPRAHTDVSELFANLYELVRTAPARFKSLAPDLFRIMKDVKGVGFGPLDVSDVVEAMQRKRYEQEGGT